MILNLFRDNYEVKFKSIMFSVYYLIKLNF